MGWKVLIDSMRCPFKFVEDEEAFGYNGDFSDTAYCCSKLPGFYDDGHLLGPGGCNPETCPFKAESLPPPEPEREDEEKSGGA